MKSTHVAGQVEVRNIPHRHRPAAAVVAGRNTILRAVRPSWRAAQMKGIGKKNEARPALKDRRQQRNTYALLSLIVLLLLLISVLVILLRRCVSLLAVSWRIVGWRWAGRRRVAHSWVGHAKISAGQQSQAVEKVVEYEKKGERKKGQFPLPR
jgi:hypothetical protein